MADKLCEISAEDYTAVYELWQHCDGLGGIENQEQFVRFVDRNPGLSVTVRRWCERIFYKCTLYHTLFGYQYS